MIIIKKNYHFILKYAHLLQLSRSSLELLVLTDGTEKKLMVVNKLNLHLQSLQRSQVEPHEMKATTTLSRSLVVHLRDLNWDM